MTRAGLEGFGKLLTREDEVVVEANGNNMAVVRVLSPFVARVIVANPLEVKAIAHAHVKTDRIDAGVLACAPPIFCPTSGCRMPRQNAAGA
jgi:transposase